MARRTYKKKTAAEHKEAADALRAAQRAATLDLLESENWKRFLATLGAFRSYSFHNTLLIIHQCPEATRVAGFKVWQKLGRRVVSGPGSGIKIWGKPYRPKLWVKRSEAPNGATILDTDGDKVKILADFTRCPRLTVFDISQTEGEPLPDINPPVPDLDPENSAAMLQLITDWITGTGWTVELQKLAGGTDGFTRHDQSRIVINDALTTAGKVDVLLHEAAHMVLHGDDTWAEMKRYHESAHRGLAEVQAESAAFTVAGILGIDTTGSSIGYSTGWARAAAGSDDPDAILAVLDKTAGAVKHAVDTILDGLEEVSGSDQDGATDVA